jgi:N-acylglucosamine 2-epimerase
MKPDFRQLLSFYREHVYQDLAPYWMRQVDRQHGGVLNCLSNRGDRLLHEHKFVWSQGRFAWEMAHLYEVAQGEVAEDVRAKFLDAAKGAVDFLMKHARLENGNCAFVLSRDGRPILLNDDGSARPAKPGEVYDYSISADDFAAYGVSEYARVTGDAAAWAWAKDLYRSIQRRHADGAARQDYPYPPVPGYRGHGMGAIEEAGELARTAQRFQDPYADELNALATRNLHELLDHFVLPPGLMHEKLGRDLKPVDTLVGRYVNPGHTLECVWFMLHHALRTNDRDVISRCAALARTTCQVAWDREFGGIPQFMDQEGGQPKGPLAPEFTNHVMVQKIRTLWDKKLWWPHSEALYALLLVYELTREDWALTEYQRFHDYTFKTFPNPDRKVGEWIQIRNRKGEPEEAVVALPVKDPMHIVRAFLHAIDVLKRLTS